MNKTQFICSKHNKKTSYLHFRSNLTGTMLKCFECGRSEHIDWNDLIQLSDLLKSNILQISLTSLQLGEEWKKRLQHFQNPNCSDREIQLISTFYDDLQQQLQQKIQERKKSDLAKAAQLQKQYKVVIQRCSEITSQQKLIKIFKNHESYSPSLNEELKQFFSEMENNQKDNQKDVKEAVEEFERLFSEYDPKKPFDFNLREQLQSLTFFPQLQKEVKTVEDIQKQFPIFLANQTEYLSQILKDTAQFLRSPPINTTSFNAAKIGKQFNKIESGIDILYMQKQRELEEQISSNYLSKQILDEIKTAPLKHKFNCLANLISTVPIISAIDILKQRPGEIKFEMIKSKFQSSEQDLVISRNQQGFIELNQIYQGRHAQAFTDFTLISDIKYLIQFQILIHNQSSKHFMVGLSLDDVKDQQKLQCQNLGYAYYAPCGLTKKIKGQDLYLEVKDKKEYKIEMQICLEERKLICYDVPDKKSVCQISEDKIDPKGKYRLGVELHFNGDKVQIQSFQIVEKFIDPS